MTTKSRMLTMLFSAVLWIGMHQTANAFYNPSTGRWLSRDPIEDKGAPIFNDTTVDNIRYPGKQTLNPFKFVLNNGIDLIDKHGTTCLNPCGLAKAAGLDGGMSGGVVCCGGKKLACVWALGPVNNSTAKKIIFDCAYLHEWQHFDETERCPPCDMWPSLPAFTSGKESECRALTVEYECLRNKRQNGACNGDGNCNAQLLTEMLSVVQQRDKACNITFRQ